MTDCSAASRQMIDENPGNRRLENPPARRWKRPKKGGFGVGCVLCWLSSPELGIQASTPLGERTDRQSSLQNQNHLRAQFGQACVAGVWQACRRAEVQDPGSGTACHWPVTRRLKGTRVLRVGVGRGVLPAKKRRRDSLVGRLRVQCPPFGSCEQARQLPRPEFFGSMKAKQVDARRLTMAASAPNFCRPVP